VERQFDAAFDDPDTFVGRSVVRVDPDGVVALLEVESADKETAGVVAIDALSRAARGIIDLGEIVAFDVAPVTAFP
jgi:hypothetical protein